MLNEIYKEAQNLEKSLSEIYVREQDFEKACNDDAQAEHAFKLKYAQEFLSADGSVDARKATALTKCSEEHLAYLKATAVRDFTKEKLRDSQAALSARQSLLTASVKSDMNYTRTT